MLYPVQIPKTQRNNNERRFVFAGKQMKKNVEIIEKMVENHWIGDIPQTGTEFDAPYAKELLPN